jgi:hypothetical protein
MDAFKSVKTERAAIDSGVIGITREHGRNPHRRHFGVPSNSREGVAAWIFFKAVLTPSDVILMLSWKDRSAAEGFSNTAKAGEDIRIRRVRVIRDYGIFDRSDAP